ncbi:response regulator [Methanolobus profundi]|uniref:histidine kinase n=1 Tax=Methanolobus profundi TaxID=487685 RepID=A0A1I4TSS3_9EURY|nr:response regulator [Methanolobus profundi]SFM79842.1 PAS domain S-box-containing protein [Methanolobus profundi]
MKIRSKTLVILGTTFFCLILLLTLTVGQITEESFKELEEKEVSKNIDRVNAAIESRTENLVILSNDWGHWDDSYYYLLGEDEFYVENNLDTYSMENLQIDMMLFYDDNRQLYSAIGADLDSHVEEEVSEEVLEEIGSNDILFSSSSEPSYVQGIINTPEGPMLVSSNPVTRSTEYEPIAGTLIVGKYIDQRIIEELEHKTKLYLDIQPIGTEGPDHMTDQTLISQNGNSIDIEYLNGNTVRGTDILNDINGDPMFTLEIEMTRDIYQQGQSAIAYLLYAILLLGFIYGLVLIISLEKYVLSRISLISKNLKEITKSGTLSSRVDITGSDELYDLSENINYMLETLEDNEKQIQEAELISKKRMESIVENIISGVIVIDEHTHLITDVNPVAEEIIGLPKKDIIGKLCHEFVCPAEKGKCPISDLGDIVNRSERILINAKGENIPILKSVVTVTIGENKYLIESFVDMTKIKEAENDLIQAKIEAESANRAKSDFLATMSHELRTPLNSIIGFSDLIIEGNAGEMTTQQERYLSNISASGKHLLSLINNVLDLSKIEAGKLDLHIETFPVEEVFTEVSQLVAPLANKKGVIMSYTIDESIVNIYADKIRFKQILYNLISNAIKFTPKGGKIEVIIERRDGMDRIYVKDTGIGISEENMQKLFIPFTQLDSAANRQYEGTGLGLSLVKKFIALHNGSIWVESEEGKGTTFVFEIPGSEDNNTVETQPSQVENKPVNEITETSYENTKEQNLEGDDKLILVVEDDDNSRELLEATLSTEGYKVVSVNNGKEALDIARELKPFVITLDVMMPGMDGWEVLSHLKADKDTKDIPVIMISMMDEGHTGIVWGAVEHFLKPVQKDKLISAIDRIKEETKKHTLKVLIADDEKAAVEVISEMVSGMDLEIMTAYGGQEAIDIALRENPDLVILDLMMPEVSGFDVVNALRSQPTTSDISIVICTAKYLDKEDEEALDGRVLGVMQKGEFSKEKLVSYIRELYNRTQ